MPEQDIDTADHRVDRVDPHALVAQRRQGEAPRLLDVRTPAEYEAAHIDGAVNVPLDVLEDAPGAVAAELDGPAVLVCRSGARAEQARRTLDAVGGAGRVSVLEDGVLGWERAGGGLTRGRQRWDIERQVRFTAGLIVLVGIVASVFWPPARFLSGAVGLGLVVAAATNTCAMGMMLARMPWNATAEQCDLDTVLGRLRAR
jgi:rhodanese-related sulfurtransferase